ncbi:MAG: DUF4832 domain-containing protein [Clostridiales bacterium]|nr:DUF4832 domain-containing protein [Clostridiales bacterium]
MKGLIRLLAGLLLTVGIALPCACARAWTVTAHYPASDAVLQNPFIGNAVWANDAPEHEQPFTLVYADLTWADFEPEEGRFDFAGFERRNQFKLWRALGKRVIFRFVMDVPGDRKHMDIPAWLYQATGKDGIAYRVSYGRGYSPDYQNPLLIEAHAKAIAAIGERYGDDPLIAYVELGSLGHWGEWHVHEAIGDMPPAEVCEQYVLPYFAAFPNAKLMMRRPFAIAAQRGMGLYNDAAGSLSSTRTWLDWIMLGDGNGAADGNSLLLPMPDAWRTAPIGGELATAEKRDTLLDSLWAQTMDLFTQSHTSWIGPGSFSDVPRGGDAQQALDQLMNRIGYRLRVDRCTAADASEGGLSLTLVWHNDGIAPFYFDWPATLRIEGADGARAFWPLPFRLAEVLPGEAFAVETTLPKEMLPADGCALSVGIVDPATGDAGVALAMDADEQDLWYPLLSIGAK